MHELKITSPTIFTIFGATGDLARKKIFPALLDLLERGILPDQFRIIAFSRRDWNDDKFRSYVYDIISEKGHEHDGNLVDSFVKNIVYVQGTFDDLEAFVNLSEKLNNLSEKLGGCVSRLFYFATPPRFYETIAENLHNSKAAITCSDKDGWSRILVEKPFGRDIESAKTLDEKLCSYFQEDQIYRIDHYIAKETISNILLFRFSNAIFEPLWSNKYIDRVELNLYETVGLEGRVTFYDGIGALRDVGQNHLLQMLALITMENPGDMSAESIRQARADVLRKLRLADFINPFRAQYEGYTSEDGIDKDSVTETFFRLAVNLDDERWHGVPFIIESGKALAEKNTEIIVHFKPAKDVICANKDNCQLANVLKFRIQPNEGFDISFWVKKSGFSNEMVESVMSFNYNDIYENSLPDAYQHVLFSAMTGDQTLFPTADEEKLSWQFITPLLDLWQKYPLQKYKIGEDPKNIK